MWKDIRKRESSNLGAKGTDFYHDQIRMRINDELNIH